MSILGKIIKHLNGGLLTEKLVKKAHGIAFKGDRVKDKSDYLIYIGAGQASSVTDFDKYGASSFWVRRGKFTINATAANNSFTSCATMVDYSFTLSLVSVIKRDLLPCDSADAVDEISEQIISVLSGEKSPIVTEIPAQQIYVQATGYSDSFTGLVVPMEYAVSVIDFNINVRINADCILPLCGSSEIESEG